MIAQPTKEHRMYRKTIIIALAALALSPAVADAHKPNLSLARADRAAAKWVAIDAEPDSGFYLAPTDADEFATVPVDRYELDPCEAETAYRATCDATFYIANGDTCDSTYTFETTRRNKLLFHEDVLCDSDPDSDD